MKKSLIVKSAALLGSVILTAAGCVGTAPVIVADSTPGAAAANNRQFQRLARNIDSVARQLHKLEKRLESLERLENSLEYMAKFDARMEALEETAEQSEQMALRNQSIISELKDSLSIMEEQRVATAEIKKKVRISAKGLSQEKLYLTAYQEHLSGNYIQAIELFSSYLAGYPESRLADNALYWIGEAYYKLEDFSRAVKHLKKVAKEYPRANKAPYALYSLGLVYQQLGDSSSAEDHFKKLTENYPGSELAELARMKIEKLQ